MIDAPAPENKTPEFDPVQAASTYFGLQFPKFAQLASGLSAKSARRVLIALMAQPLEDHRPNLNREEEMAVYLLGEKLLESKIVLVLHTLMEEQEKIEKIKAEASTSKESETTNG